MESWKSIIISPDNTVIEAIRVIDGSNPILTALVVDDSHRLLGTVTDGDIRRGILDRIPMDAPVSSVMHTHPITLKSNANQETIHAAFKKHANCRVFPILDDKGRLIDLEQKDTRPKKAISNPVFIMAGGLGTRLRPLTNDCPKPLLKIGKKPILEIIIDNFIEHGFFNFYISINYKGEMIEDYFGDGSHKNISINYLKEKKRLGTAGSLSLIESIPQKPIIVMNGDLLTKVNFQQLLDFHNSHKTPATLCVREHDFQIPFGVVQVDNCKLTDLKEKPIDKVFVNAGIYVLDPDTIKRIPKNKYYDMTDLFSDLLSQNEESAVFPVHEYWMDIGRLTEYQKADEIYPNLFDS